MQVKTVSFKDPQAPAKFTHSLKETGFAVISDHPLPPKLIDATFNEWAEFFATDKKVNFTFKKEEQAGYFPFKSENAKDSPEKDLKEFFHYYPWGCLPESCKNTENFYAQLNSLALQLLTWIDENSPEEVRKNYREPLAKMATDSPMTLLRPIHYPPLTGDEKPAAVRAAAHEDINLITLLPAATEPGLQVRDTSGNWHNVVCDQGTIVVNNGDMLTEASGGYFPSTTHQVINPKGEALKQARYSMPLFLHPRPEVVLSDTHTADSYLKQRLKEIGLL